MKLHPNSPHHLTYCTNIHPGEDWDTIFTNLKTYIPQLQTHLAPHQPFAIGLRLSDRATRQLLNGDRLSQLRTWLHHQNAYIPTLNCFPYSDFHNRVVKDRVYAPDWASRDRLDYILRAMTLLSQLLPDGLDGNISTVPISYNPWWHDRPTERNSMLTQSCAHLAQCALEMATLHQQTGTLLHLGLEPEPDAVLTRAEDVITFFNQHLLPQGSTWLTNQGLTRSDAETLLRTHIRLCYDTCHFAVEFEDPADVLTRFHQEGIRIGKIQLSAALQVPIPSDRPLRQQLHQHLTPFAESTYLHQVVTQPLQTPQSPPSRHSYPDLQDALPHLPDCGDREWRIHYHVPIFAADYPHFHSTQADITQTLAHLHHCPDCHTLEIETYTWDVLPPHLRLDITQSIQREYEWVLTQLPFR